MELTTNEFQRASRDPEPCVLRLISLPVDPEKNIDQVGWASDIRNRVHSLILEERKGQLEWYYDAMRSEGYDGVFPVYVTLHCRSPSGYSPGGSRPRTRRAWLRALIGHPAKWRALRGAKALWWLRGRHGTMMTRQRKKIGGYDDAWMEYSGIACGGRFRACPHRRERGVVEPDWRIPPIAREE